MSRPVIGVFDSGMGGLSVAQAIQRAMSETEVVFRNDAAHLPYGTKRPKELYGYVLPILQELEAAGCSVIVVACNTVSTTLMSQLRRELAVPLIAVEPMVKRAAELTVSKIIAVCATPTTLKSGRYAELKRDFATGIQVLEPDCSDWAQMIEDNKLDAMHVAECIKAVLKAGADVIVLGCTHYHWIEEDILQLAAAKARVLQPEPLIIAQLRRELERQR